MPSASYSGPAITSPPGDTMHAPPRPKTSTPSGSASGKSAGNAVAGMNCGTLTTNAPASMAMWRIDAIQPSLSSAVGASQICGPPSYTRPPRQRHAVLPADEPADPTDARELDDAEVVARPDAVEDPLVHRRHELAVPVQHAVAADDQQRVVERAGPVVLPLVDADGEVDAALGAGLGQAIDQRPVDVDARRPHPLPQLVTTSRLRHCDRLRHRWLMVDLNDEQERSIRLQDALDLGKRGEKFST